MCVRVRVHFVFDLSCVYPRNYCEVRECVACIDTRIYAMVNATIRDPAKRGERGEGKGKLTFALYIG